MTVTNHCLTMGDKISKRPYNSENDNRYQLLFKFYRYFLKIAKKNTAQHMSGKSDAKIIDCA